MLDFTSYIHIFFTLFSILNPIGVIPIFLAVTANESARRKKNTIKKTVIAVLIILLIAAFAGNYVLSFFGVDLDSFRVAGGILLLLMSINMLQAKTSSVKTNEDETSEAVEKEDVSVIPLAIPLLAGPGSISTVRLFSSDISSAIEMTIFSIIILVASLSILPILFLSEEIGNRIGTTGLNIATRVMGLFLAAIAVKFIFEGTLHYIKDAL